MLQKFISHVVSVLIIILFCSIIFSPQLQGKKVIAHDTISAQFRTEHIRDYGTQEGKRVYWNPSEFSGNPIYLLSLGVEYNILGNISSLITFGFDRPIGIFILTGLLMYLALVFLGLGPWLSLAIALAYCFNVNTLVLFDAGHVKKILTIAYFPLVLSGLLLALRSRYIQGGALLAVGGSLAIYHGHVQMVYYLGIILGGFSLPILFEALRTKQFKHYGKVLGWVLGALCIAVVSNYAQLQSSLDFSGATMRGGSVLEEQKEASDDQKTNGLTWDYAMNWSFENQDFLAILAPRMAGGGSSEKIDKKDPLAQLLMQNGAKAVDGKVSVPGYWSSMPFTSGPPYFGVTLLFLFVLALCFFRPVMRWAFIVGFLLFYFISLGKHAAWFNATLFEYFPFFDKFRTPSSVTVFLPAFVGIGAAIGIQKIESLRDVSRLIKPLMYTTLGFGFVLLFLWLFGESIFSFTSAREASYSKQVLEVFQGSRMRMQSEDIMRSLLLIISLAGVLYIAFLRKRQKSWTLALLIGAICLIDILPTSTRYLGDEKFVSERKIRQQFKPRSVDREIQSLENKSRGHYRVLDLSVNTFNDARPSLHHNQIGGYNPAKLSRYQNIIEQHISKGNKEVLNMLNAKYIISREGKVNVNKDANGAAWMASEVSYVSSPQQEIASLSGLNTKKTAVILQSEFPDVRAGDGKGEVELTSYAPNRLEYKVKSSSQQLVIFSEVWFGGNPDWVATIDGEQVDFIRANFILRGLSVPGGEHRVVFEYAPLAKGRYLSLVGSISGILLLIGAIYSSWKPLSNESVIGKVSSSGK